MENNKASTVERKLSKIRRWRRMGWIFIITLIPTCFISGIITGTDKIYIIIAVLWTLFAGYYGGRAFTSKCPNCGNYFYIKKLYNNPLAQRCLHCKISIRYKDNDA
jgi:hypothetical protein